MLQMLFTCYLKLATVIVKTKWYSNFRNIWKAGTSQEDLEVLARIIKWRDSCKDLALIDLVRILLCGVEAEY